MSENRFQGPGPFRPPIDRSINAHPLTDATEVRAARARLADGIVTRAARRMFPTGAGTDPDWLSAAELGPEQYDSHDEYMAALDRERWGDAPFEDD